MKSKEKYVAYYRVSTQRQGVSGLGLEAQKEKVYSDLNGGELIGEYTEIESGSNGDRVELNSAIDHCKSEDATLIIAKLDRLSRSVSFIFQLRDAGVKFRACDLPDFNTMTLGIFATFAEYERERISTRTKEALEQKRKRSGEWRVSNLDDEARQKAVEVRRAKARSNGDKERARNYARLLRDKGMTLKEIAALLSDPEKGYPTPMKEGRSRRGKKVQTGRELVRYAWYPAQVSRLLKGL